MVHVSKTHGQEIMPNGVPAGYGMPFIQTSAGYDSFMRSTPHFAGEHDASHEPKGLLDKAWAKMKAFGEYCWAKITGQHTSHHPQGLPGGDQIIQERGVLGRNPMDTGLPVVTGPNPFLI